MAHDLLVYGAGLMGQQLASIIRNQWPKEYRLLGYVDDSKPAGTPLPDGLKVLNNLEQASKNVPLVFAIGYRDMHARLEAFMRAKKLGFSFATLIHPKAQVESDVSVGEGCFVHAGAVIDTGGKIGPANYVDIGVLIGERVTLGAGNYISAGAIFGGNLTIGYGNFFGLGCVVRDGIEIGNYTMTPAQGLVHKSMGDHVQVMEARTIRLVEGSV